VADFFFRLPLAATKVRPLAATPETKPRERRTFPPRARADDTRDSAYLLA